MGTTFRGIDISSFNEDDEPKKQKPEFAPTESTRAPVPQPPKPNTIRSTEQSDLEAAKPINASKFRGIDLSSFNEDTTNIDNFINQNLGPNATPDTPPSPWKDINEIALNLMALSPNATGEDAMRRRGDFFLSMSQVPEGSLKNATIKAADDLIGAAKTIFEHSSFGTALGIATGKLSPSELKKRNIEELKSLGAGAAGLAKFGFEGTKNIIKKGPVQGPVDFVGSIIHSLATDPINRVFGASTGVNAADGFSVLTPEQRADDVKFTAALVVTGFAGKGINKLVGEGITEVPMMSQAGKVLRVPGRSAFRRFGVGALEGAAGGTIFGAISRAGAPDNEYFSGIVTDALMFGSFGSTINLMVGKRPIPPKKLDAVGYAARLLQASEESTLGQIVSNKQAVLTSQNIVEAAIKGQIVLDPDKAHIFTGLTNGREIMDALGKGANIRSNGKGGWDLLYLGKDLQKSMAENGVKLDIEMWHRTGFMSGQTVSIGGHEYKIIGEGKAGDDGVTIRLQDKNGVEIEMPSSALRNIPGSEFRGRNQAAHPNTLFNGVAYRGTRTGVDPLTPGHVGATFMSEDPVFATIHSEKGGAVHRIEYNFKNPKQIPEPSDITTRQQYIRDEIQKAYEEGHDGLFIGELGSERLEIIDVTNDKTGLKVKERIDRSAFDANDIDFYMKEIKPRINDGMTFHDAVAEALGLTPEEMRLARSIPEEDATGKARVKRVTEFEKNVTENAIEQSKEPFVDPRSARDVDTFSKMDDVTLNKYIESLEESIREAKDGINSYTPEDIPKIGERLDAAKFEAAERMTNDPLNNISTPELETLRAKADYDLHDNPNPTLDTEPNNLFTNPWARLRNTIDKIDKILERRRGYGRDMIEFKRKPDSALKNTKVLDEHGNARIVYHGTHTSFNEFSLDAIGGGNLMGPGFYFTEDPNVASSYTKKNGADIGDLERFIEGLKIRRDDLKNQIDRSVIGEKGVTQADIDHWNTMLEERNKEIEIRINELNNSAPNVIRVKLDIRNPFDADKMYTAAEANKIIEASGGPPDYFKESLDTAGDDLAQIPYSAAERVRPELSGKEIIDQIMDTSGEEYVPIALKSLGYDGITHQGGIYIGNKEHKVWIAFDPEQVHPIDTDLVRIDRMDLDYTPPKIEADKLVDVVAAKTARQMELIHDLVGQDSDPYAMVQVASSNGFNLNTHDGVTTVMDAESGLPVASFSSAEAARDFVRESGQAHGVDLTDGGGPNDPPPIGPEGAMPPDGPPPNNLKPFPFRLPGKLETFFDALNAAAPWIAMKRTYFTSLDKLHGTEFFSKVYQPTQVAALKALAVTRELMVPLSKIEKKAKGLNLERRAVIARYRQTMSPQEIIDGLFQRKLTPNEIAGARYLAGEHDGIAANIDAVYDYLRDVKKLNQEYEKLMVQMEGEGGGQPIPQEKLDQHRQQIEADIVQLQELHGLTAKDLDAAALFEKIKRQNLNDESLFGVTELAKAILEDRPDRAKFAKDNKMTEKELEIAQDFDNLYSTLADLFGIDNARRINGFMNHYRRHGDMPHVPVEKPLAGKKSASKFLSELIRSGELYNYIDDPFHAAAAYIRSGVNARVLNKVWSDARRAAQIERAKLPQGAQQQFANVADEYFNEIKGIPGASDNAMQVAFDTYFQKIGRNTSRKVRGDIINGILSTIGSSLLGFKPELGLRDIGSWFGIHGSRFGYSRSMRALRYAFERDKDGISVADKMLREGHFPGLSPIGVQSASELAAIEHGTGIGGRIAKFGETVGEAGLKVSLQKNFYAKMHAGAYLEASRRATKLLQDFRDGKISRERAYDRLDMHTYENPVAKHFDDLVVNGKDAEAAHFLGLATAIETNFFHGLSNHPYKWGSNIGRVAGQFGQWSMFSRDYLVRLASRGTPKQRAAAIGRFAINMGAIHGVGRLLGFNMRAWQVLPGLAFTGGPLVQVMGDNIAMTGAFGTRKQKEAIGIFWNQHLTTSGFRSMFVPGSYAFHDIMEAYASSQDGYGLIPVVGRGFGFKIDHTQRSFMDDFLGNYPRINREKPLTTYLGEKVDKTFR